MGGGRGGGKRRQRLSQYNVTTLFLAVPAISIALSVLAIHHLLKTHRAISGLTSITSVILMPEIPQVHSLAGLLPVYNWFRSRFAEHTGCRAANCCRKPLTLIHPTLSMHENIQPLTLSTKLKNPRARDTASNIPILTTQSILNVTARQQDMLQRWV